MTETKNCQFCSKEFEGGRMSKYCCDICKELAGVERRTGFRVDTEEATCDGKCNKAAKLNIAHTTKGWVFIQKRGYAVKAGVNIVFCPFCGGRLE